jgi:PAS domain S-box-containing protein
MPHRYFWCWIRGLISYANRRCYEAGYKQDEMIGRRLVDLVDADTAKSSAALDTTAHGMQCLELRARRSDGTAGHFSISLSPIRDEQNTEQRGGGDDRHHRRR